MPSVIINEKDFTVFSLYGQNNNIVWIPGFAITGPYDSPVLLSNPAELKNTFGDVPPTEHYASSAISSETQLCTGWEFAYQMLSRGFKVLFQRIVPYTYDTALTGVVNTDKLKSATTAFVDGENFKFAIKEKFGGTYGNRLDISFVTNVTSTKLYLKVVDTANSNKVLEYKELYTSEDGKSIISNNSVNRKYLLTFAKSFVKAVKESSYIDFVTSDGFVSSVSEFNTYIASGLSDGSTGTFIVDASTGEIVYNGSIDSKNWECTSIIDTVFVNSSSATASTSIRFAFNLGATSSEDYVSDDDTHLGLDYTYNDALEYKAGDSDTTHKILAETIMKKLEIVSDKILYDVKFVTLGNISIGGNEIAVAGTDMYSFLSKFCAERGDCCAILNPAKGVEQQAVSSAFGNNFAGTESSSYSAVFAPWCIMTTYENNSRWCSPAMVFLDALAKSVQKGNPVYLPPAGVNRATVTSVTEVEYPVGSAVLADWQNKDKPNNINPIMFLNGYGYVIFGQRTLYDVSDELVGMRSALQELGVRLTVIECKKKIRDVAMGLLFEYNNIHTWNEFKSGVTPLFDEMLKNGALQRYKIVMDETTMNAGDIDDNVIRGIIKVVPGRAVEDFIISFELYRSGVTFDNEQSNV